ncbi:MAG: putative quinol monooxygenase [Candidatus Nitrosocosmicus sp.]
MVNLGLIVRLHAKPGKESDVENILRDGLLMVQDEPSTVAWFAFRIDPLTFGIFDGFQNEAGRQEHLSGKLAAILMEKSSDLFSGPPTIEKVDVIAAKLPQIKNEEYEE